MGTRPSGGYQPLRLLAGACLVEIRHPIAPSHKVATTPIAQADACSRQKGNEVWGEIVELCRDRSRLQP